MMLQAKGNDQLVVSAIQRNGNAARSGLRVGDQVVSAGGGKLSSMEEFKQIAKTLGQGDQIEVEFVRNGKKQKSLLQFGVAPEEGQIASAAQTSTKHIHSEVSEIGMQSVLDSPVEHVSRLEPILTSSTKPSTGKITSLNQTIEQQQQKMQAMAEELKLLRKAHQPAVEPTENNWSFPDLAGPGQ